MYRVIERTAKGYRIEFKARVKKGEPRRPYVARLVPQNRNYVNNAFLPITTTTTDQYLILDGTFFASAGAMLEVREAITKKKDKRFRYLVLEGGKLRKLCRHPSERSRIVDDCVLGRISIHEMLTMLKRPLPKVGVAKQRKPRKPRKPRKGGTRRGGKGSR
ncbi:MAG: hypothetical protein MRJ68_17530 [Nitrospira sp.]|nr:hypothetical protein [Nitrospira sp.]